MIFLDAVRFHLPPDEDGQQYDCFNKNSYTPVRFSHWNQQAFWRVPEP
jgi:hypothetical protein